MGIGPHGQRAGVASHGAHGNQRAGRSRASGAPVLRYANGTKRGNSASVCAMKHARTPRASGSACARDAQTRRTQRRQVRVSTVPRLHAHMRARAPARLRGACMEYAREGCVCTGCSCAGVHSAPAPAAAPAAAAAPAPVSPLSTSEGQLQVLAASASSMGVLCPFLHAHTRIHAHTRMHAHVPIHASVSTYTCTCPHTHASAHIRAHTHARTHARACLCVYGHTRTHYSYTRARICTLPSYTRQRAYTRTHAGAYTRKHGHAHMRAHICAHMCIHAHAHAYDKAYHKAYYKVKK